MSGLASSIGGLFGGSAAKTDRKQQLAGFGDLSNLFNFGMNSGSAETGQSQGLLGQAGGYYSSLLSGNRQATLGAVAPTANAATGQADATKRGIAASGTARGGGVNATTATINDQTRASIDTAVNSAKAGAAAGATSTGGTMASQASQLLGIGGNAAGSLTADAGNSRATSSALHNAAAGDVGGLVDAGGDLLSMLWPTGGSGGGGSAGTGFGEF